MGWHMIWTLLLMICFFCIIFWAYSSRRKSDFDEASRLPLENDSTATSSAYSGKEKSSE